MRHITKMKKLAPARSDQPKWLKVFNDLKLPKTTYNDSKWLGMTQNYQNLDEVQKWKKKKPQSDLEWVKMTQNDFRMVWNYLKSPKMTYLDS